MLDKYNRHSIRLNDYDYSSNGYYFITICTHKKEVLLGEIVNDFIQLSDFGEIAYKNLLKISEHYINVKLDKFVIMPNHVHIIFIIENNNFLENNKNERRKMLIPRIVGYYKMNTAKEINILRNIKSQAFWQRNYYERIIRTEEELNYTRKYIEENPIKWVLDKENPFN